MQKRQLLRQETFSARIDQKGRISIPSAIRKSFALREGSVLELVFDLGENFILLFPNGQDGVGGSTKACEALRPGSNPGPDPQNKRGRGYGR